MSRKINSPIRIVVIALLLTIVSCAEKEKVVYRDNGRIEFSVPIKNNEYHGIYKEFDDTGKLIDEIVFKKGLKHGVSNHYYYEPESKYSKIAISWKNDSAYYRKNYNISRELISEGRLLRNGFRIGKWTYYNGAGRIKEVQEFLNIADKPYLNQSWFYNTNGDILQEGTHYKSRFKDTVRLNENNEFHFALIQPLLSEESEMVVCLPENIEELEDDFTNEYEIKWDTIENLAKLYGYKYRDYPLNVVFDYVPNQIGTDNIRGYLLEKHHKRTDSFDLITHKIYFNIPFYVQDTSKLDF